MTRTQRIVASSSVGLLAVATALLLMNSKRPQSSADNGSAQQGRGDTQSVRAQTSHDTDAAFASVSGSGQPIYALIASPDYYSGITIASTTPVVRVGHSRIDDLLIRRHRERDPSTLEFIKHERTYSVSYDIAGVAPRTPSDIFVFGHQLDGASIVERWSFSKVGGGYYASRSVASVPVGTPYVTPPTSVELVGMFVDPTAREVVPPTRRRVYSGTSLGVIRGLGVDPDGRYLLLFGGDSPATAVYRVELTSPSTPTLRYDAATMPELTNAAFLTPFDHDVLGRIFISGTLGHPWNVVLYDVQNDGTIDTEDIYSEDLFRKSPIPAGVRGFVETY